MSSSKPLQNLAAWIDAPQSYPLVIRDTPVPPLGSHQILIKNYSIAINPADRLIQAHDLPFVKYPYLAGQDVAGVVEQIGPDVSAFKVGDRVLGHADGFFNEPAYAAFQLHSAVREELASHIPDTMSFEEACVIPLGFSTAAVGLYVDKYLHLNLPSLTPVDQGKVILIWGGSSSVGSNAIQLAVASGYEVFTTCSPKNSDMVTKTMGASRAFDYHSSTIVQDIVAALKGKVLAGSLACIATENAISPLLQVVSQFRLEAGDKASNLIASVLEVPKTVVVPENVEVRFFMAMLRNTELAKKLYGEFLPQALAKDVFHPLPPPRVVGHGLEAIQDSFKEQEKVSAEKIVVTLVSTTDA